MRQIFGGPDAPLNYLGYSYGTSIGALYAHSHPERVGRMVLDSPVDLAGDSETSQAEGFDQAYLAFANWCAAEPACLLGDNAAAVVATAAKLLDQLDETPLPVGGRWLTQSLALDGLAAPLYGGADSYFVLADLVAAALAGDGAPLLQSSDNLWQRNSDGYTSLFTAFTAIRCRDQPDDGIAAAYEDWEAEKVRSPLFGAASGPDIACTVWPVLAAPEPDIQAVGAGPILVVGAAGDSATPYEYAEKAAESLPSAVLVTYDGPGHGTYGSHRSSCVDGWVESYLNTGAPPPAAVVCR
jgi:pimeloyl-ACP methyl ester carboxylesterase